MKIKLLFIAVLSVLGFTSCEDYECKKCNPAYQTLNGYNLSDLDSIAVVIGYPDWDEYMQFLYPSDEKCDGTLTEAESLSDSTDLNGDGINDYRFYWDCF